MKEKMEERAGPVKNETRLRRLGVDFPYLVAPMVGLSHVAFRELIRHYTPRNLRPLLFTEMISSRLLPREKLETAEFLRVAPNERGFVAQLLGNEERFLAPSLEKLMRLEPWGIDINMGCPATHTLRHNWGVLLMGDRKYAAEVVAIARRHTPVPLSVKLRSSAGDHDDLDYLVDFTAALEDAGADWITVHARPRGRGHTGEANWSLVGELARRRAVPVVANGDIQTAEDALAVVRDFGADGAMIARAATARPWILWQIADSLGREDAPWGREGQRPPRTPEEEGREYFRACATFAELLAYYFGEGAYAMKKLQFFIGLGAQWIPFGHSFWKTTLKGKTLRETRDIVLEYGDRHPQPFRPRLSFH